MRVRAQLYQQFDADPARAVPAESYGGWIEREVEVAPRHTALVVMHAWDCGQPHEHPGWRRAVEYMPRAENILRDVFPELLRVVRASPLRVFHVVGGSRELRAQNVMPGAHNAADVTAGFAGIDFAPTARPVGTEGIARNGVQLGALCRAHGINHLIYVGFAINWCLLMSPGGMVDMARQGCLCSTIAEATTAVENRETAREEREKTQALWRVAIEFGFVFRLEHFLTALRNNSSSSSP
jgi:hypothetical protein